MDVQSQIDESTINKINALMNLTDHRGATESEAKNASAHVMRLLAKYNLSMATFDKIANKPEEIGRDQMQNNGSMPVWKSNLLSAIAKAHFCAIYLTHGYRTTSHVLVGKPTNVQAVKIVYAFLTDVIETDTKSAFKAYTGFEHGKTYCNSFRLGMVSRISERLREEMKAIHEDQVAEETKALGDGTPYVPGAPQTSIVVKNMFDDAQKEIREYYRSVGIKLGTSGYSGTNKSGAGYHSGRRAGENVPLHASPSLNARN